MLIPTEIDQAKQHRALLIQQKILQSRVDGRYSQERAAMLQHLAVTTYCDRINGV